MALKTLLGIVLITLLISCNQQSKNTKPVATKSPVRLPGVEQVEGKPYSEAQRLLGEPVTNDEYYFGKVLLGEFRVPLTNFFDVKDSADQKRLIKEVTWHFGRQESYANFITVWYVKEGEQWKYLDYIEYIEGTEF
jgi:hypothetical protein